MTHMENETPDTAMELLPSELIKRYKQTVAANSSLRNHEAFLKLVRLLTLEFYMAHDEDAAAACREVAEQIVDTMQAFDMASSRVMLYERELYRRITDETNRPTFI